MAKITAAEVNKLRKQTGAGMMDCKKALVEATPISGPALVNKTKSDSLASELVGTLQMASEPK